MIDGFRHRTRTGKIVYPRRVHVFRIRDLLRIALRINFRVYAIPGYLWLRFVSQLLKLHSEFNTRIQIESVGSTPASPDGILFYNEDAE